MGLAAPQRVESSQTRDRTGVPRIARQIYTQVSPESYTLEKQWQEAGKGYATFQDVSANHLTSVHPPTFIEHLLVPGTFLNIVDVRMSKTGKNYCPRKPYNLVEEERQ